MFSVDPATRTESPVLPIGLFIVIKLIHRPATSADVGTVAFRGK